MQKASFIRRITVIEFTSVGFGLAWALNLAVLFSDSLFFNAPNRGADSFNNAVGAGEFIVLLTLLMVFGRRGGMLGHQKLPARKLIAASLVLLLIGDTCIGMTAILASDELIKVVGGLSCGCGFGVGYYVWLFLYSCRPAKQVRMSLLASWVSGSIVFMLIALLPSAALLAAMVSLAIASCWMGLRYAKALEGIEVVGLDEQILPCTEGNLSVGLIFAAVVTLGIVYGIGGSAFVNSGVGFYLGGQPILNHFATVSISVLVVMIALLLPTDKINLMLLFQVAFTVDVTATIALPFVGLWYVDVFNTIVSIVFRAMMLLVFYLCATMHNHAQFRKVAPIMLSASWVGLMVGIVFGQNLYTTFENHSMVLTVITVIVLYLVFMASSVFTVMRKHQANESSELPEKARTMEDVEAEACRAIALRYSLSDRETEVLGYLIKGRSATFISGELYLSINTVKSYMKTLYAKLDVHSKQELINLVEATSSAATSAVDASR